MEKLFEEFVTTTKKLRAPGGCPWDIKQTHESLIKCLREECEEVVKAIENKDDENLKEELGDLLLNIIMQADISEEEGKFNISDVLKGVNGKLIRRHPHVFGTAKAATAEEGLALWKAAKEQEKKLKKK